MPVAMMFWMSVCRVPMSMNQTHDSSVSICVFQELMGFDVMNAFRKYVYNAYNDHFQCIQLYTVMRARCSRTHERHAPATKLRAAAEKGASVTKAVFGFYGRECELPRDVAGLGPGVEVFGDDDPAAKKTPASPASAPDLLRAAENFDDLLK